MELNPKSWRHSILFNIFASVWFGFLAFERALDHFYLDHRPWNWRTLIIVIVGVPLSLGYAWRAWSIWKEPKA
jgi:hypothetical protein